MEIPTTVFPDLLKYQFDTSLADVHVVTILTTPSRAREERWVETPPDGFSEGTLVIGPLNQKEREQIRTFYKAMRGEGVSFYLFDPFPANYYNANVGTVNNESSIIIPYKSLKPTEHEAPALFVVLVGGVSQVFTVTEGAGTYGQARINFGGPRTGNVVVTMSAKKMHTARFTGPLTPSYIRRAASLHTYFNVPIRTF